MYILYLSRSTTLRCFSPDHNCTKIYACMSYITICTVWCISRAVRTAHAQTSRSIAHTINAAAISRTSWITQQPIKKEHNSTVGMRAVAAQHLTHIYLYIYSVHKQRQQSTHAALHVNNVSWNVSAKPAEGWCLDRRFVMWYMLHYGTAINKNSTRGHILHNALTYNAILARIPRRIIIS